MADSDIEFRLQHLPQKPGVYRMIGGAGEVLYVGKARNLRSRVTSYFRASGLTSTLNTPASRTRRAINCAYWLPKSSTSTASDTPSGISAIDAARRPEAAVGDCASEVGLVTADMAGP